MRSDFAQILEFPRHLTAVSVRMAALSISSSARHSSTVRGLDLRHDCTMLSADASSNVTPYPAANACNAPVPPPYPSASVAIFPAMRSCFVTLSTALPYIAAAVRS